MKSLLLVRHASSGCDDMSLADRFRPVDARGERELRWLARHARDHGSQLEWIVSSPALRALTTARVLAEALGLGADRIAIDERLYEGGTRRLVDAIAALDDRLAHVAVVGHNPELADLGRHLAARITHLPSAGIAAMRFDAREWRHVLRSHAAHAVLDAPPRPSAPGITTPLGVSS